MCFSPRHDLTLAQMAPADVRRVVDLWAEQTAELGRALPLGPGVREPGRGDGRLQPAPARAGLGRDGAADVERHARTPPSGRTTSATGRRCCCDVATQEADGPRVVEANEHWLAIVPFWARLAVRDAVLPRAHVARLPDLDAARRDALAAILGRTLRRYDALFGVPFPYSMGWHGAPFDADAATDAWVLHAHVYPPLLRRRPCASSWSATSCSPSRSATSRPRTRPRASGRSRSTEEGVMRLWGGRFDEGPDARMADFTRSIDVDAELALDDIAGSIAHVRGLGRAGLLTDDEVATLERGLVSLRADVEAGAIAWDPGLEDVHLNLETLLTERVGTVGGKLHTGRSRNDQVATDLRLWTRRAIDRARRRGSWRWRSRSSTSRSATARPSSRARPTSSPRSPCCSPTTCSRTSRCWSATAAGSPTRARRVNVSPLGAGALAGAGYPLDRETTAAELGFDGVTAQLARCRRATGTSSSRCWRRRRSRWSTSRGSPRSSPGGRTRGSGSSASRTRSRPARSMMPNKKNPDPAELVRGRSAGVIGALTAMLTLLKGLPLAYQRDLQEDKPRVVRRGRDARRRRSR